MGFRLSNVPLKTPVPLYRFSLDVPAPVDVVAERVRVIVRKPPGFWESFSRMWQYESSADSTFVGSVIDNSFQLHRNVRYRNSFLPQIRGKMAFVQGGTRVNVVMFVQPVVLIFVLFWLGGAGYGAWRGITAGSAQFYTSLAVGAFGLAVSLGRFFSEAMKAKELLSTALFNSTINSVPPRPVVQPQTDGSVFEASTSQTNLLPLGFAFLFLLVLAGWLYEHRLQTSPAYTTSLALLSQSRDATAELGQHIQAGTLVRGVVREDAEAGYASLSIPVQGTRAKGTLYVVANRVRDRWNLERVALWTQLDSKRLDLSPPIKLESFHYPTTGMVYLVPLDSASASQLQNLPGYYAARLGLNVTILPVLTLGPEVKDPVTKQIIAEKAIPFIARANSKLAEGLDSVFLGVTSQDLNIKSAGWDFATNYRLGPFAIISTARLLGMPWFAGDNPEVIPMRVRKMVTKNVALLRYPIGLSADPTSALATSVFSASDVDQMGEDFLGERGAWSADAVGAPCFSVIRGPHGSQSWRTNCTGEPPNDSRFETFENYTDITLLVMSHTDFPVDNQPALSFIRKYRPQDNRSRSFGLGGNDSFDIWPGGDSQTFSWLELFLEDGGRIHYNRVSKGTGWADAKLRAGVYTGSPFSQSTLDWNGNGWDVKTVGGVTYKFPSSGPDRSPQQSALERLETGAGAISIQRNSDGALQRAVMPGGSWIKFTCDSMNRVTLAQHSSGRSIRYEYESGRLIHIQDSEDGEEFYHYDSANRLTSVLDATGRAVLTNTYGYLGEVTSQTLSDHRTLRYEYGFDENQKVDEVSFTDDHGYLTRWIRGRDGFYGSLPQPPRP